MNLLIETLNVWADHALGFAWPMLWQSSLLIGVLFLLDLLLRRKLRPAVRYALWLVVLVKLLLPPSLAFPTSAGWWLRSAKAAPAIGPSAPVVVTYDTYDLPIVPATARGVFVAPPPPRLSAGAWAFVGTVAVSLGLLAWMLLRWHQVTRDARRAAAAPGWVNELLPELPHPVRLRLTDRPQSPAVCGLFRPVILLPRSLAEQLPPEQLRAVLLHELLHLRRGDVWVNCAQALLQVVYWWHPLLWLANARIRRVREEAVDDAVMLALNEDAESYAPTLLEVAKLALQRPLASLGLVGILESRSSLRQRIERLMDFRPPRKAGLSLASALGVLGFAALAVPMGEAPAPTAGTGSATPQVVTNSPAPETSSSAGFLSDQKVKASGLVQDAKLLYEMGKLDQAEAKLQAALRNDPRSKPAVYYLKLVSEAKLGRASPSKRELLPVPNVYAHTNLVHPSQARQAIMGKLDRIRLDSVSFEGLPLKEVVRSLADESRKRDPEKRGINFVLNQNIDPGGAAAATAPVLGPDGNPIPAPPPEQVDMGAIIIKINPPLTDIRLADVLDAIVKVADPHIKYSIEDYAIVFSLKGIETTPLYVRTFKVDPNTLFENLHVTIGRTGTDGAAAVVTALREWLAKAGVDLDPATNSGKALFFNDRQGTLLVRATLQDLDVIEGLIQVVNATPPQINIKAKFVEISQDDTKALGLDWYLGNVLTTNGSTGGQVGPAPSSQGGAGLRGNPAAGTNGSLFTLSGILTEPQYLVVLKALQQREGTKVVAQPEVTLISGRQAQCKAAEVRGVVKGIDERALTSPGITSTNEDENAAYEVEPMEFGPVLDITPTVLSDGHTVNMSLVASLLEFLGYEDNRTNRVTVYVNGKPKQVSPPQPIVRTAQVTSQVNVWDGQTLLLGGLVSERTITMKDKVPVLGDLPGVGPLFRSESKNTQKRNLLVFITPTIIDSAGHRVHAAEETPPARDAIPPQPAR